jgi:hypothetical protein
MDLHYPNRTYLSGLGPRPRVRFREAQIPRNRERQTPNPSHRTTRSTGRKYAFYLRLREASERKRRAVGYGGEAAWGTGVLPGRRNGGRAAAGGKSFDGEYAEKAAVIAS